LILGAELGDQVAPLPVLAERLGDGAVSLGELRHDQRLGDETDAVPAPFLRHRRGAKAQPRALADDVPVPGLPRMPDGIARRRDRADFLGGEAAGFLLPLALLVVQCEVHAALPSGSTRDSLGAAAAAVHACEPRGPRECYSTLMLFSRT